LAVLKEQVLEDNLKRQRLLKRFADNPQPRAPSRAQRRDRPQAFPRRKHFLDRIDEQLPKL